MCRRQQQLCFHAREAPTRLTLSLDDGNSTTEISTIQRKRQSLWWATNSPTRWTGGEIAWFRALYFYRLPTYFCERRTDAKVRYQSYESSRKISIVVEPSIFPCARSSGVKSLSIAVARGVCSSSQDQVTFSLTLFN